MISNEHWERARFVVGIVKRRDVDPDVLLQAARTLREFNNYYTGTNMAKSEASTDVGWALVGNPFTTKEALRAMYGSHFAQINEKKIEEAIATRR